MTFDHSPENIDQIELRRVGGQEVNDFIGSGAPEARNVYRSSGP